LAAQAVERARDTDDINLRADTLVAFADVAGDETARTDALHQALELYDTKGNVVSAGAVARRLAG
jgi:hypothetical protein